jgi:hypothetical protein
MSNHASPGSTQHSLSPEYSVLYQASGLPVFHPLQPFSRITQPLRRVVSGPTAPSNPPPHDDGRSRSRNKKRKSDGSPDGRDSYREFQDIAAGEGNAFWRGSQATMMDSGRRESFVDLTTSSPPRNRPPQPHIRSSSLANAAPGSSRSILSSPHYQQTQPLIDLASPPAVRSRPQNHRSNRSSSLMSALPQGSITSHGPPGSPVARRTSAGGPGAGGYAQGRRRSDIVLPRWQPDAEATNCPVCGQQFTLLFRRHHCR